MNHHRKEIIALGSFLILAGLVVSSGNFKYNPNQKAAGLSTRVAQNAISDTPTQNKYTNANSNSACNLTLNSIPLPTSSLTLGTQTVSKFSLTASSGCPTGTVFSGLRMNFWATPPVVNGNFRLVNTYVVDSSTGTAVSTTSDPYNTGNTFVFSMISPFALQNGIPKVFEIHGDILSDALVVGNTLTTSIPAGFLVISNISGIAVNATNQTLSYP